MSPNFYICWYDPAARRIRRKTTRSGDVRIAIEALDRHYLASAAPADIQASAYSLSDVLADYWLEHGSRQSSAQAIKSRLKHLQAFIDHEVASGRLKDPVSVDLVDDGLVTRFRDWLSARPIVARRKNDRGEWIDGQSRPRSAATVEEAVIALKAALNHALKARRIRAAPYFQTMTRRQVSAPRRDRISVPLLAEMLMHAHSLGRKGDALQRYLIGAICTIARPDAVLDISVKSDRGQWLKADRLLDLNPRGRIQTKKHRPTIPVVPLLEEWLDATDEWLVCRQLSDDFGQLKQQRVLSIRSAWDTMRLELGLPAGWGPKLIRHSIATELRAREVDPWQLSGWMGHQTVQTTEIYAIFAPNYLSTVVSGLNSIISDLERLAKPALHPNCTQIAPRKAIRAVA